MSSEKESESRKSSSEEISREFKTLVNSGDLHSLNHMQHTILGRLQDSNAVLSHFNDFSQHCFAEISGDIARNTRILKSVKSDLDYIFQKLSFLHLSIQVHQGGVAQQFSVTVILRSQRILFFMAIHRCPLTRFVS
ncbi:hypothetical protein VIGAN_01102700 [Vigna angularis var. angularis]|uniref:KxDL domain-containing protein n=1 Tax=Vigna angularis var. angularis TaxID=157739 RepID=A0A0S3QYW7_PHAAN|nr:hypothetical protein VIGAN_01102700 [Vigna angularis var. angularis]